MLWGHVGSSQNRDQTCVPCIRQADSLTTRSPGKPTPALFIPPCLSDSTHSPPSLGGLHCTSICIPTIICVGEGDGTHSSALAWKIPWTEEPGGLRSMGSLRVRHDRVTSLSLSTFMHWKRKWQPTLVFLPGESQGRGSLVGCRLWGHTELDTTDAT